MRSVIRHPGLVALRLARFLALNSRGWREHRRELGRVGKGSDPASCAAWLHKYGALNLEAIGFRFEHTGKVPTRGMVVCNHLSYLDIPLLVAAGPMVFVSKAEVANWPMMGALARCGGTLFLRREQRSHVAEIADAFRPIVESGTVVTIFPEGTSSGGDEVLPFRPSLLEPAAANGWPVTPAWLTYEIDPSEGTRADDVAYWRDMTFAPHFLNLLAKRTIRGRVFFGEPVSGLPDRKQLARRLHEEVSLLRERHAAR
jgi:1-acyl-sn-glycerol-3-phosphate acyltransferase